MCFQNYSPGCGLFEVSTSIINVDSVLFTPPPLLLHIPPILIIKPMIHTEIWLYEYVWQKDLKRDFFKKRYFTSYKTRWKNMTNTNSWWQWLAYLSLVYKMIQYRSLVEFRKNFLVKRLCLSPDDTRRALEFGGSLTTMVGSWRLIFAPMESVFFMVIHKILFKYTFNEGCFRQSNQG